MAKIHTEKKIYPVLDMSCAACAVNVEKILKEQSGVVNATVNFPASTVAVEYDPRFTSANKLKEAVRNGGYDLVADLDENTADEVEQAHAKKLHELKMKTMWAVILSVPIVIIGMFFMNMPYANVIMWLLSTPVVFWFGKDFFINAFKQLRHKKATMDTLVALSTGIAYIFSMFNMLFPHYWLQRDLHPHVYFEAAAVIIAFILLGRYLEERAKGNTSSAIKKLIGLQPKSVTIIQQDGSLKEAPVNEVMIGDMLLVRPGDKIAVDGMVTEGESYVDESMLSGEPVPVFKEKEEKIYAGTINGKGSFRFRTEKVGSETMLAQIIRMVQDAQGSKAPVQKLVDKIAAIFVPVIITIAIIAFALWLLFDPVNGFTHGLMAMVTVLIIACPCALGLATPTAITVGIGKGAEKGILIKDSESLEIAKNINAVVLDKTGTITEGKPEVTDVYWLNNNDSGKDILWSLEKQSEHPLAEAITRYFKDAGMVSTDHFESITGKGIIGEVKGQRYYVGSRKLLSDNNIDIDSQLLIESERLYAQSKTIIWFSDSIQTLAVLAITDRIKDTSRVAVEQLRSEGIEVYMLTGDNENTAHSIAAQAGIIHFESEVLPQQKSAFIKQLQSEGKIVAMVGDGINDSAALAQADLSIAMGKGSDIAMDVAKMTIISSDLTKIPEAIKLSCLTVRTIKQNLFWAFIYNLIGVPIAAGILYPINGFLLNPMIAGAAMALSSVSVVSNSLRLKSKKI